MIASTIERYDRNTACVAQPPLNAHADASTLVSQPAQPSPGPAPTPGSPPAAPATPPPDVQPVPTPPDIEIDTPQELPLIAPGEGDVIQTPPPVKAHATASSVGVH
jgi:hypothetical protein